MARTIAIGDVHGCSPALAAVLAAIDPQPLDTIVTLGDYVDRGPDSKGVIERLLALAKTCRLIPILGNHEEMMLAVIDEQMPLDDWLRCGGAATVDSYSESYGQAAPGIPALPPEHLSFLRRCEPYYETDTHLLLHANYDPALPLAEQSLLTIRWLSLRESIPPAHISGKTAILGHTPTRSGEIFDRGYLKCIDTYCYGGGWLTAIDLASGQLWQADRTGRRRS
jgi:calcineurin-like phosphoesterase family protein